MLAKAHHLHYMLHRQYRVESSEWAATWGWCQSQWNGPWSRHWKLVGEAHHLHYMLHRQYRVESSEWAGTGASRSEAVPEVGAEKASGKRLSHWTAQLPCRCGNLFFVFAAPFCWMRCLGVFVLCGLCFWSIFFARSKQPLFFIYIHVHILIFTFHMRAYCVCYLFSFTVSYAWAPTSALRLLLMMWLCLALGTALCCNVSVWEERSDMEVWWCLSLYRASNSSCRPLSLHPCCGWFHSSNNKTLYGVTVVQRETVPGAYMHRHAYTRVRTHMTILTCAN